MTAVAGARCGNSEGQTRDTPGGLRKTDVVPASGECDGADGGSENSAHRWLRRVTQENSERRLPGWRGVVVTSRAFHTPSLDIWHQRKQAACSVCSTLRGLPAHSDMNLFSGILGARSTGTKCIRCKCLTVLGKGFLPPPPRLTRCLLSEKPPHQTLLRSRIV